FALVLTCGCCGNLWAGDFQLFPADVVLTGPRASQRLLALRVANGQVIGDQTERATFTSSNPAVAAVDPGAVVRAVGNRQAVVTASLVGQGVAAKVTVRKTNEALAPTFRNAIIPLLTKIGCNSGACHGALAGKGGLKLSLRGYAPSQDHFVMTRQALNRRVD